MASVPPMDWKSRSTGRALLQRGHLGGEMGEDAALRGDGVFLADEIDKAQQGGDRRGIVGGWVDADDCVAGAEREAVDDAGGDTGRIVGGMIRLQTGGEATRESDRGAEFGDYANFLRHGNQVLRLH